MLLIWLFSVKVIYECNRITPKIPAILFVAINKLILKYMEKLTYFKKPNYLKNKKIYIVLRIPDIRAPSKVPVIKILCGVGKMPQELRVFAFLQEYPSLGPWIHGGWFLTACDPVPSSDSGRDLFKNTHNK